MKKPHITYRAITKQWQCFGDSVVAHADNPTQAYRWWRIYRDLKEYERKTRREITNMEEKVRRINRSFHPKELYW